VSGVADAYRIFVDGRWRASEGGATFEATSPSTGEVLGTVPEGTREDVRRAIDAANRAWPAWAVRAGWVNVNEGTNYWESHLPFGGASGSRSGVGRVGGRFSMDRLTELKTIVIDVS
jgi:acyl-CoA reductase-like NAD-dependent aldehyde dehydrogenase